MSNPTRALLGVLSFAPLAWMGFFIFAVVSGMNGGEGMIFTMMKTGWFFPLHIGMALTGLAVSIGYVAHACTTPDIDEGWKRAVWAIVLLQLNALVLPYYWYRHIWSARPQAALPGVPVN